MSTQSTIYLDYASTTPVDPRVASKMMEFLTPEGEFGNPASRSHRFGWKADEAVEEAQSMDEVHGWECSTDGPSKLLLTTLRFQ